MENIHHEKIDETPENPQETVERTIQEIEDKITELRPRTKKGSPNSLWTCHYTEKDEINNFFNSREYNLSQKYNNSYYNRALNQDPPVDTSEMNNKIQNTLKLQTPQRIFDEVDNTNSNNTEYTTIRNANQLAQTIDSTFKGDIKINIDTFTKQFNAYPAIVSDNKKNDVKELNINVISNTDGFSVTINKVYKAKLGKQKEEKITYNYNTTDGTFNIKNNEENRNQSILDQDTTQLLDSYLHSAQQARSDGMGSIDNKKNEDRLDTTLSSMT